MNQPFSHPEVVNAGQVNPSLVRRGSLVAFVLALAFLAGCQSWYGLTDAETRAFCWADPVAAARKESERPEPKLFGWSNGGDQPLGIPGFSQQEVSEYVDSGRLKVEEFYNDHLDFLRNRSKEAYRVRARFRYAEIFNRELLSLMKTKVQRQAQPAQTTQRGCTARGV